MFRQGGVSSQPDEACLLSRWKKGDSEAFGTLFEPHASALYSYACRLTGSRENAQDLIQNAVLRALSSRRKCRTPGTFFSWMRRIVTNLFLDGLKAGRRAGRDGVTQMEDWENMPNPAESAGGPGTPRTEIEQARTQEQIERALAGLPPLYRMAVILRDLEGLSYAEIAELQETTVETVRTRLRRARARLREVLRGEIPGIE